MTQPQPPTPGTRALQAVVQANIQRQVRKEQRQRAITQAIIRIQSGRA
jgi:hypothetical protein